MSISQLQRTNQVTMQCIERANGFIQAVYFYNSVGVSDEIHADARLKDVEINKADLSALLSDLFRMKSDAKIMNHFRQAHFNMRKELPDWLKNVLSVHDVAFGFAHQVLEACHNAPLNQNTAMQKWTAITKAVRSLPQVDLLPALDTEYRYVVQNVRSGKKQASKPRFKPPPCKYCKSTNTGVQSVRKEKRIIHCEDCGKNVHMAK